MGFIIAVATIIGFFVITLDALPEPTEKHYKRSVVIAMLVWVVVGGLLLSEFIGH